MPTWAAEYLSAEQADHPPWRAVDRTAAHFAELDSGLPLPLRIMRSTGRVVAGEVGLALPTAFMKKHDDDSYSIAVNSGLMEFFDTMTRTMCVMQRDFSEAGVEEPVLSHQQLVERIARIYHDWKDGRYTSGERFERAAEPLRLDTEGIAAELSQMAAIFVLAHELGHVAVSTDAEKRQPDAWGGEETYADGFGVWFALSGGQQLSQRMLYAGAVLAIRVYYGLQKVGVVFPGEHYPPPAQRLGLLRDRVVTLTGDEATATFLGTIGAAFDELLESAENVLLGKGIKTEQTPERVLCRLWAIVEEAAKGHMDESRFVRDASDCLADVPNDVLQTASAKFCGWFGSAVPAPAVAGNRGAAMSAVLRKVAPQLPEPARGIFARYLGH